MDLPIVKNHKKEQELIGILDRILEIKKSDEKSDILTMEQKIDQLVYQLYDLTLEEIQIIEESVS